MCRRHQIVERGGCVVTLGGQRAHGPNEAAIDPFVFEALPLPLRSRSVNSPNRKDRNTNNLMETIIASLHGLITSGPSASLQTTQPPSSATGPRFMKNIHNVSAYCQTFSFPLILLANLLFIFCLNCTDNVCLFS